jgi:hypothetical protein
MKVDIYRNARDGTKFHIHISGSSCSECYSSENAAREVEMPESVYRTFVDKFTLRGYIVVPDDIAINESASDWWSVMLLFVIK